MIAIARKRLLKRCQNYWLAMFRASQHKPAYREKEFGTAKAGRAQARRDRSILPWAGRLCGLGPGDSVANHRETQQARVVWAMNSRCKCAAHSCSFDIKTPSPKR